MTIQMKLNRYLKIFNYNLKITKKKFIIFITFLLLSLVLIYFAFQTRSNLQLFIERFFDKKDKNLSYYENNKDNIDIVISKVIKPFKNIWNYTCAFFDKLSFGSVFDFLIVAFFTIIKYLGPAASLLTIVPLLFSISNEKEDLNVRETFGLSVIKRINIFFYESVLKLKNMYYNLRDFIKENEYAKYIKKIIVLIIVEKIAFEYAYYCKLLFTFGPSITSSYLKSGIYLLVKLYMNFNSLEKVIFYLAIIIGIRQLVIYSCYKKQEQKCKKLIEFFDTERGKI